MQCLVCTIFSFAPNQPVHLMKLCISFDVLSTASEKFKRNRSKAIDMNQRLLVTSKKSVKKAGNTKYYSYAIDSNLQRLFICDSSKGKSVSHSVKLNKTKCLFLSI